MRMIDGKKLAKQILNKVKKETKKMPTTLGLAIILVSDNAASKIYIKKKEEACKETGIRCEKFIFKETTANKIIKLIKELNNDKEINGILVQLPLPKKFDTKKIIAAINPKKDVDGFLKKSRVIPPTIAGILKLLKSTKKNFKNKNAIILANSKIFALSLKKLLEKEGIKAKILIKPKQQKLNTDIIITALGKPKFITADMVSDDTTIIDVGITRLDKKICGDVDFKSLKEKNVWLTPVPGGVGPMTIAMLLKNILILSKTKK